MIILAGAAGGYAYVQKLRADNATLTINAVKLETAVAENNEVIEQQTQDLQKIRSTLEDVQETNAKLLEIYKKTKKAKGGYVKKYAKGGGVRTAKYKI